MKIIITENQLKSLILIQEQKKDEWIGVDHDLETSLFEYGLVIRKSNDPSYDDEWFYLYKIDNNNFDTGFIRENDIKSLIFGFEWADEEDIDSFLNSMGQSMEEWMENSFVTKLSDLVSYWGHENIFGNSYNPFSEEEALKILNGSSDSESNLGFVEETDFIINDTLNEADYKGRKVQLGKIMQGDIKKFKVYVKNDKGKVVKVNFGFGGKSAKGKVMKIKKNNPKRRKSFRARMKCDNPGPRWKPRYWACRTW